MKPSAPSDQPHTRFSLTVDKQILIDCTVRYEWQEQLYARTVNLLLLGRILCTGHDEPAIQPCAKLVATATISESEIDPATDTAKAIARVAAKALDLIETTNEISALHGMDLQAKEIPGDNK